jgi:hypothetical protein
MGVYSPDEVSPHCRKCAQIFLYAIRGVEVMVYLWAKGIGGRAMELLEATIIHGEGGGEVVEVAGALDLHTALNSLLKTLISQQ